ncbi:hypothetical protein [Sphingomonas sp. GC_Shp_3]|uniref:hypothetical protein n=1 Tax=Sphingomonas sp. GC_Shp_3 TaxID=2937383 RepID=UPI002269E464|nr:hypothetical protein [Sphingomonas sp. GC_Shp_3]
MPSRYDTTNVNVALQVLRAIVPSSQVQGDPTSLRLALRVILTHITDCPALVEFWTIATNKHRLAHQACIQPYLAIVARLKQAGFAIDAENDLHSGR